MEDKKGYVYILTNPSFKEDWVKIGKSSRPVDVRSKELDNTAVPMPFEIFACMKTEKYAQVERFVHKTIDRLTNRRIRPNREFFNIEPLLALEIFKDIAATIDGAEIIKYVNGDPVIIWTADAPTQNDDDKAIRGTVIKDKKSAFWKGYIDFTGKSDLFKQSFPLRNKVPNYSLDLPLGTSACNIFQVPKKNEVTVGIYFHGKDLFKSLLSVRDEFNAVVGDEVIWEEYEKDCCARVSFPMDILDETKYPACYDWMVCKTVALKKALSSVSDGSKVFDEAVKRAAPFRFSMIGLEVGEEIIFVPTGTKVKIVSDRQIEYQDKVYSLSAFASAFMPEDKKNASGAYCGPDHFIYDGKILSDIRRSHCDVSE